MLDAQDSRGCVRAVTYFIAVSALLLVVWDSWPLHAQSVTPTWQLDGASEEEQLGFAVASAGDVNGDGFADVIVGSPYLHDGQPDEGWARVFLGFAGGLDDIPVWEGEGEQVAALFGSAVACAGDVNGDGFADIIIGAPYAENGEPEEGRAFVHFGSMNGPALLADWTADGDQESSAFGTAVASAGDVNGDGYDDVIIGANAFDTLEENAGRVVVHYGSAFGLALVADWEETGTQLSELFGHSVASAGDVNGDGFDDVIIGAPRHDNGNSNEGRASLYLGSAAGLSLVPAWSAESDQDGGLFGWSVASAGDVNDDGLDDVIIGASFYDDVEANEGRVYLFLGTPAGLALTPAWNYGSAQLDAHVGFSVAGAGDVNDDGFADVIVGAPGWDAISADVGRALVFHGNPSGLDAAPAWTATSDLEYSDFGASVASAGDVDGDGFADLIVGAPGYEVVVANEGRAFLYRGSAGAIEFRRGDANSDALFNIADAIFTLTFLFTPGAPPPSCADAADANDDGATNIADAISMLAALFTPGAPPLPAPGAACGPDPSADALACAGPTMCP